MGELRVGLACVVAVFVSISACRFHDIFTAATIIEVYGRLRSADIVVLGSLWSGVQGHSREGSGENRGIPLL